ncbi:MAG: hypothetical protein Q8Q88_23165 [Phenylobacterium sp.]|uniref:hypothetical protein n=1 Tax=Phenylobacterium sp. TaxID=1871053 RepID=UPI002735C7AC|nr:hypothetical protein [Phenylobacterium sp.]MDP3749938.1 hypothetical protein [Phenylobacterium sp.]
MDEAVAYFLDLRLRVRRQPEARAIVDRCLEILARAADADAATLLVLDRQLEALRADLERRFGAPKALLRH